MYVCACVCTCGKQHLINQVVNQSKRQDSLNCLLRGSYVGVILKAAWHPASINLSCSNRNKWNETENIHHVTNKNHIWRTSTFSRERTDWTFQRHASDSAGQAVTFKCCLLVHVKWSSVLWIFAVCIFSLRCPTLKQKLFPTVKTLTLRDTGMI